MKKNEKNYTWQLISKYRQAIMGIAIIGIVLFHYYEDLVRMKFTINPIVKIFSYGNLGVDMFLFISGVGLYFSYKSNSNKRIFYDKLQYQVQH